MLRFNCAAWAGLCTDLLNIIKGFQEIKNKSGNLPEIFTLVRSLDEILEGLRLMRNAIFEAEGMFEGGELRTNKRAAFYKKMNECRGYAEQTLRAFLVPQVKSSNKTSERDRVNSDKQDLNTLETALKDSSAKVRQSSVEAIGKINKPESIPLLLQALDDKNPLVRRSATRALGNIKDPQAMKSLQRMMNDSSSSVRQAAIEALGIVNDQQVVSLLRERLDDNNEAVRKTAIDAIDKIESKESRSDASNQPSSQTSDSGDKQPPPDIPNGATSESLPPISQPEPSEIIRRYDVSEGGLEKHVATDKPVQSVKQDKLDFKIYVNALHSFILSKYTTTPITISIDGPWGTGKSSLMSMLKGKLDPQRDGIRKLYEWLAGLRLWWRWYFGFLKSSIAKWFGKTVISLFVRNDVDEDGVYLYFGQKNKRFHKYISDIVEGFSIDPEVLIQIANDEKKKSTVPEVPNKTGNQSMDKSMRWWAQVHANCEPMQPPYHYAVWLNAWKFDNQEEVWASLALATMEQIKQKHGLLWRLRFWWDLTFSRFSFWSAIWQVVKQFLVPLLFAIVAAYYNTIIGSFDKPLEAFVNYGNPLLWAGFVISGILTVSSIFKDPFQISLDKVFDRPNYKDKVSFLALFEKDFAKIVRSATKNGLGWKPSKLVIFIDDLDRCEPPKSADIVEAVNLFLDAEGCVFVIGMDSESVAKSVEVKYKDLFERMKAENTGVVSLGRSFLDKIVQIPFSVPRATSKQIEHMVKDSIGFDLRASWDSNVQKIESIKKDMEKMEAEDAKKAADKSQEADVPPATVEPIPNIVAPRIDPASYNKPEVQAAILAGTKLLADNPRQVKTFINLFRLSIYIAKERGILEEKVVDGKTSGLNLDKLAVWMVCSVRWSGLVRHFRADTQIDSLRYFLDNISNAVISQIIFSDLTTIMPMKNPDEIKAKLKNMREDGKDTEAHWCFLPWEWWLLDPDFLKTIKSLQDLWSPPSDGEIDWLKVLLTMTKPIV